MTDIASFIALAALMTTGSLLWLLRPVHATRVDRRHGGLATRVTLMLLVPVLVALLYARIGRLDGLSPATADPARALAEERTARLAARLASNADEPGLRLLARSYDELRRFDDAAAVRARLVALQPDGADAVADLAETLATTQGGRYVGRPTELANQVLERDPLQPKALAIAANAAAQRGDFAAAIAYWQRLGRLVPAMSEVGRSIDRNIADARRAMGDAGQPK